MGEFEMGAMMAVRAEIRNWELSFLVSIPSLTLHTIRLTFISPLLVLSF